MVQVTHLKRKAPAQYSPDFAVVPMQIGDYQGHQLSVDQSIYRFLEADAMTERRYESKQDAVKMTLLYGSEWRTIHSPAGCYPAGGWQVVTDEQVQVPAPAGSPTSEPLEARLLHVRKNEVELLAMFSFCHPGGTTGDWARQGWQVATGPRGAGGLVITLGTPIGAELPEARQRLMWFLQQVYPDAVKFWYEDKRNQNVSDLHGGRQNNLK